MVKFEDIIPVYLFQWVEKFEDIIVVYLFQKTEKFIRIVLYIVQTHKP